MPRQPSEKSERTEGLWGSCAAELRGPELVALLRAGGGLPQNEGVVVVQHQLKRGEGDPALLSTSPPSSPATPNNNDGQPNGSQQFPSSEAADKAAERSRGVEYAALETVTELVQEGLMRTRVFEHTRRERALRGLDPLAEQVVTDSLMESLFVIHPHMQRAITQFDAAVNTDAAITAEEGGLVLGGPITVAMEEEGDAAGGGVVTDMALRRQSSIKKLSQAGNMVWGGSGDPRAVLLEMVARGEVPTRRPLLARFMEPDLSQNGGKSKPKCTGQQQPHPSAARKNVVDDAPSSLNGTLSSSLGAVATMTVGGPHYDNDPPTLGGFSATRGTLSGSRGSSTLRDGGTSRTGGSIVMRKGSKRTANGERSINLNLGGSFGEEMLPSPTGGDDEDDRRTAHFEVGILTAEERARREEAVRRRELRREQEAAKRRVAVLSAPLAGKPVPFSHRSQLPAESSRRQYAYRSYRSPAAVKEQRRVEVLTGVAQRLGSEGTGGAPSTTLVALLPHSSVEATGAAIVKHRRRKRAQHHNEGESNTFGYIPPISKADAVKKRAVQVLADYIDTGLGDGSIDGSTGSRCPPEVLFQRLQDIKRSFDFFPSFITCPTKIGPEDVVVDPACRGPRPWDAKDWSTALGGAGGTPSSPSQHTFALKSSADGKRLVPGGFPEDLFRVFIAPVLTLSLDDAVNARLTAQLDVEASGVIGWDDFSLYLLSSARDGGGMRASFGASAAGVSSSSDEHRFSFAAPKEFLLSDRQRSERGKLGGDASQGAWTGQVQAILRRLKLASLIRGSLSGNGGAGGGSRTATLAGGEARGGSRDDGEGAGDVVAGTGVCRHNAEVTRVLFTHQLQAGNSAAGSTSVNPGLDRFVFTAGLDGAVHMWDGASMEHQTTIQAPHFSHTSVFYEEIATSGAGGAKGGTTAAKGASGLSLQSTGGEMSAARYRHRVNDLSFSSAGHLLVAQSKGRVMSYIVNPQSRPIPHRCLRVVFGRTSGFANMHFGPRRAPQSHERKNHHHLTSGCDLDESDTHHTFPRDFDEDDEDFVQLAGDKTAGNDVFLLSPFPGDVSAICGLKGSVAGVEVGAGVTSTTEDKVFQMMTQSDNNARKQRASTSAGSAGEVDVRSVNFATTATSAFRSNNAKVSAESLKRAGSAMVADPLANHQDVDLYDASSSVVTSGSSQHRLSAKQCSASDYFRHLTSGLFFRNRRRMTIRGDPDPASPPPFALTTDPSQQPVVLTNHAEPILVGLDTGVVHLYNIHPHPSFTTNPTFLANNTGGSMFGKHASSSTAARGYYQPLHTFASNCLFRKGPIWSLIDDSPVNHQFLALGGIGEVSTASFGATASYLARFDAHTREGVHTTLQQTFGGASGYYRSQRRLMSGMHSVVQFVDYETMTDTNTIRLVPRPSGCSDSSIAFPCTGMAFDSSLGILVGYGHYRTATVFSAAFGNVLSSLDSHAAPVIGVAINAAKGELVIGTEDRVVHIYDVRTYQKVSSAVYRHPSDDYARKIGGGSSSALGRCVAAGTSGGSSACVMSPFTCLGYDVLRQRPVASTNIPVALVERKADGEALSAFVEEMATATQHQTANPPHVVGAVATTHGSGSGVSMVGKAKREEAAARARMAGLTPSGFGTEMHTVAFNPHFRELALCEGRRIVFRPQMALLHRTLVGGWRHSNQTQGQQRVIDGGKSHQVEWSITCVPPFSAVEKSFPCRGTVTKLHFDLHGRKLAVASAGCRVDVMTATTGALLMAFTADSSSPSRRSAPLHSTTGSNEVLCVEFACLPDGTSVLAVGTFSGLLSLRIHDRDGGDGRPTTSMTSADGVAGSLEVYSDQHSSSVVSLAAVGRGASKLFVGTAAGQVFEYDLEHFRRTLVASYDLLHDAMRTLRPKATALGSKGSSLALFGRKPSGSRLLEGGGGVEIELAASAQPSSASILSTSNIRRRHRNMKRSAKANEREERRRRASATGTTFSSLEEGGLGNSPMPPSGDDAEESVGGEGSYVTATSPFGSRPDTPVSAGLTVTHAVIAVPAEGGSISADDSAQPLPQPRPMTTRRVSFLVDPSGAPVAVVSSSKDGAHLSNPTAALHHEVPLSDVAGALSHRRSNRRLLVDTSRARYQEELEELNPMEHTSTSALLPSVPAASRSFAPRPPKTPPSLPSRPLDAFRKECHNAMDAAVELICSLDDTHVATVYGTGQVMICKVGQSETLRLFSFQAIPHTTSASAIGFHRPTKLLVVGDFTGAVSFFDLSPFYAHVRAQDVRQLPLFYGNLNSSSAMAPGGDGRSAVYDYVHFLGVLPLLEDGLVSDLCFTDADEDLFVDATTAGGGDTVVGGGNGVATHPHSSTPQGRSYGSTSKSLSEISGSLISGRARGVDENDVGGQCADGLEEPGNSLRGVWQLCQRTSRNTVDLRRKEDLHAALVALQLTQGDATVSNSSVPAAAILTSHTPSNSSSYASSAEGLFLGVMPSTSARLAHAPHNLSPEAEAKKNALARTLAFAPLPPSSSSAHAPRSFSLVVSFSEAMLAVVVSLPTAMISNVLVQPHRLGDPLLRELLLAASSYRLGHSAAMIQRETAALAASSSGVIASHANLPHHLTPSVPSASVTTGSANGAGGLRENGGHTVAYGNSLSSVSNLAGGVQWQDRGPEGNIERCFTNAIGAQFEQSRSDRRRIKTLVKRLRAEEGLRPESEGTDGSSSDSSSEENEGKLSTSGEIPSTVVLSRLKSEAVRLIERGCSWFVPAVPPSLLSTVMRPRQIRGPASEVHHPEGLFELYSRIEIPSSRKEPAAASPSGTTPSPHRLLGDRYLPVLAPSATSRRERSYYRFKCSLQDHPFFLFWALPADTRRVVEGALSGKRQLPSRNPSTYANNSSNGGDELVGLALEMPHVACATMSVCAHLLDERLIFRPMPAPQQPVVTAFVAPSSADAALSLFGGALVDMTPPPAVTLPIPLQDLNYHRYDEVRVLSCHPPTIRVRLCRGGRRHGSTRQIAQLTSVAEHGTTGPSQPTDPKAIKVVMGSRIASLLGKHLQRHDWFHSRLIPLRASPVGRGGTALPPSGSSSSLSDTTTSSSSSVSDDDEGATRRLEGETHSHATKTPTTSRRGSDSSQQSRRHRPAPMTRRLYISPGSSIFGNGRHWAEEAALLCTLQERLQVGAERRKLEEANREKKRQEAEELERQAKWPKGPSTMGRAVGSRQPAPPPPAAPTGEDSTSELPSGTSHATLQRQGRQRRASNALRNSLFKAALPTKSTSHQQQVQPSANNEAPPPATPPSTAGAPVLDPATVISVKLEPTAFQLLEGDRSRQASRSGSTSEVVHPLVENPFSDYQCDGGAPFTATPKQLAIPAKPQLEGFTSLFESQDDADSNADASAHLVSASNRRRSSVRIGGAVGVDTGTGAVEMLRGARLKETGVTTVEDEGTVSGLQRPPTNAARIAHPADVILGRTYHSQLCPAPRTAPSGSATPGAPVPIPLVMSRYVTELGYSDHRRIEIVKSKGSGECRCLLVEDAETAMDEAAYIEGIFSRSFHEDRGEGQSPHLPSDEGIVGGDLHHHHAAEGITYTRSKAAGDGTRPSPSHMALLAARRRQLYQGMGGSARGMNTTEKRLYKVLTSGDFTPAAGLAGGPARTPPGSSPTSRSPSPARRPGSSLSRRNSAMQIFTELAREKSESLGVGGASRVFEAEERRSAAALGRNRHRLVHEGIQATIKRLEGASGTTVISGSDGGEQHARRLEEVSLSPRRSQGVVVDRLYPAPPPYRMSPRAAVEQYKVSMEARLYAPSSTTSPRRTEGVSSAHPGNRRALIDYSPRRPASAIASSEFIRSAPAPLRPGEQRDLHTVGSEAGSTLTKAERLMLQGGIRRDVAYVTRSVWLAQPPQMHSIVLPPPEPEFPQRRSLLVLGQADGGDVGASSSARRRSEHLWRSANSVSPRNTIPQDTAPEHITPQPTAPGDRVEAALAKAASLHSRVQVVRDERQRKVELARGGSTGGPSPNTSLSPSAVPELKMNRVFSSLHPSPLHFSTSPRGSHKAALRRQGGGGDDPLARFVTPSPRRTPTTTSGRLTGGK